MVSVYATDALWVPLRFINALPKSPLPASGERGSALRNDRASHKQRTRSHAYALLPNDFTDLPADALAPFDSVPFPVVLNRGKQGNEMNKKLFRCLSEMENKRAAAEPVRPWICHVLRTNTEGNPLNQPGEWGEMFTSGQVASSHPHWVEQQQLTVGILCLRTRGYVFISFLKNYMPKVCSKRQGR